MYKCLRIPEFLYRKTHLNRWIWIKFVYSLPFNVSASLYLGLFLRISCQLDFGQILVLYLCKFQTGEPCPSAVCSRKQNQFIIYATHFRFVYIPKSRFLAKKAVHSGGPRKRFYLYFLNGYRYLKNFNSFDFQVQRAINSEIFKKIWRKKSLHC